MSHIHVVGSGVLGLTTALLLTIEGYKVTIISKHFPGDQPTIEYTSPWAGARWQSVAAAGDFRAQRYEGTSFKRFWKLALEKDVSETGIMAVPAYDYYKNPSPAELNPWYKSIVPSFQILHKDELPEGMDVGYHYTTVVVYPAIYLKWLMSQFLTLGGKCKRMTLESILDAVTDQEEAAIVVNCAGVHTRTLGGVLDTTIVPTRGQNVILRAPHIRKTISINGPDVYNYVIPRPDGTVIVGTTHETYSFDTEINQNTVQGVLIQARSFCPEIKATDTPEIVGYVVGVRPTRHDGPRVETECKELASGKRVWIVHNYGHGGYGYIASWGSSEHAVELVRQTEDALEKEKTAIRSLLVSHL